MIRFDKPLLDTFGMVEVRAEDLDLGGHFTRNLAAFDGVVTYRLHNRAASQHSPENVLSLRGIRQVGSLTPCYNVDHYATEASIISDGPPHLYCLMTMLSGALKM